MEGEGGWGGGGGGGGGGAVEVAETCKSHGAVLN